MRISPGPRTAPADLRAPFHHRLNMYALAATAAGVGILGLEQPVEAKIIYTPANRAIAAKTFLDLNHDRIHDFKFINIRTARCHGMFCTTGDRRGTSFFTTSANLAVYGLRAGNQIYGPTKNYPSALYAGVRIGPSGKFPGGNIMAKLRAIDGSNQTVRGYWAGFRYHSSVNQRYLGLRFTIKGKVHYGWARLNVIISGSATIQATLTGYAYETIPDKPIVTGRTKGADENGDQKRSAPAARSASTPQPTMLGALALGSAGLSIWRREPTGESVQ